MRGKVEGGCILVRDFEIDSEKRYNTYTKEFNIIILLVCTQCRYLA